MSMHPARERFTVALVAAVVVLCAFDAHAFERQWRVGGGAGIATLDEAGIAPAVDVHGAYGLSDMFDVNLELLGSRHRSSGSVDVLSASAGLSYKVDVFQWVPYVELTGGLYYYGGDGGPNGEADFEPGAAIGIGLDYLATRSFSLGIAGRQHTSFSDGLSFPYLSATLRAAYRWGW